jgi:hypothetical protein
VCGWRIGGTSRRSMEVGMSKVGGMVGMGKGRGGMGGVEGLRGGWYRMVSSPCFRDW